MDTSFLASFLLTVDTGSMAEAARRLDLTPAAIAQQIRSLERELGVTLISRVGRTVRPTDAGHGVVERARAVLREITDLKAAAQAGVGQGEVTGELRLGSINTALHTMMPDILVRLNKAHPKLKVFIQSALSHDLFQAVQRGDVDAALCLHPQFALPKTCGWQLLREEPLVALVPRRLANRDPHELLRSMPFIRYDRNQWGGRQAEQYLLKAGIAPNEQFELSYLGAIAAMVERGLGISLVPDAILPGAAHLRVERLPLPIPTEPRRIGILWMRSSIRARPIQAFVHEARLACG
jgi:DNA-binding transcriptional LysR family regulator